MFDSKLVKLAETLKVRAGEDSLGQVVEAAFQASWYGVAFASFLYVSKTEQLE